MKRFALLIMVIVAFMLFVIGPTMARDLEETGDTIIDTLSGENASCPTLFSSYIAKTFEDVAIPVIGKTNVRGKLEYISSIRNLNTDNSVQVSVGLEF